MRMEKMGMEIFVLLLVNDLLPLYNPCGSVHSPVGII